MGYTKEDWKSRIAQRNDITTFLVHLTRGNSKEEVMDVLIKILEDKCLFGSSTDSGFIIGDRRAVCLQEAPIYSLAQNIYTEQTYRKNNDTVKERYVGWGLQFRKGFVYEHGGRPVIYDKTSDAKSYLPSKEWWRIVNFDLSNEEAIIDWTHEREWRVPEKLDFPLSEVAVLLPSEFAHRAFVKKCIELNKSDLLSSIRGIVQLGAIFY